MYCFHFLNQIVKIEYKCYRLPGMGFSRPYPGNAETGYKCLVMGSYSQENGHFTHVSVKPVDFRNCTLESFFVYGGLWWGCY